MPPTLSPLRTSPWLLLPLSLAACESLAGFEDFTYDISTGGEAGSAQPGQGGSEAGGQAGAGTAGASGQAGDGGSAQAGSGSDGGSAQAGSAQAGSAQAGSGGDGGSAQAGSSGGGAAGAGGDGQSGSAGTAGSATACAEETKAGKDGRAMARIDRPGVGCFWMDVHEVSRQAYAAFLDQVDPLAPGQDTPCDQNTSLQPDPTCETKALAAVEGKPELNPAVCIDWCDAFAYCKWAGKRLCHGDYASAKGSEWYAACSNGGADPYPHGNSTSDGTCNTNGSASHPSGDSPGCVSKRGVADLSGNAAEWTDECQQNTSMADPCRTRGGSYQDLTGQAQCTSATSPPRSTFSQFRGFRCCADGP